MSPKKKFFAVMAQVERIMALWGEDEGNNMDLLASCKRSNI
jgi:hypothetical protein